MGFCSGIENYSRHLDGRAPGEPPYTLIDYFPDDFLCIIDESHVTVPQIRGMHEGDRSPQDHAGRARLPAAQLPGQPAACASTSSRSAIPQFVYVSATPGDYELNGSASSRWSRSSAPPGLLDPEIIVRGSA